LRKRTARLRLLQQLQEKWEGFGEGAKAGAARPARCRLAGAKATPISQGLEVKPEFGKAVEAISAPPPRRSASAISRRRSAFLAQLDNEQIGSAVLHVGEAVRSSARNRADGRRFFDLRSRRWRTRLGASGREYFGGLLHRGRSRAFLEFWKANPSFAFLAVATRKGDLVDRRGLVYGGHHSGRKSSNSIVQREIDLRETAKSLADDQKLHDDQKAAIDTLAARLAAAEQAVEQRRAEVLAVTQTWRPCRPSNAVRSVPSRTWATAAAHGERAHHARADAQRGPRALGKSPGRTGHGGR